MKRKILSVLIIGVLFSVMLCGCGKKQNAPAEHTQENIVATEDVVPSNGVNQTNEPNAVNMNTDNTDVAEADSTDGAGEYDVILGELYTVDDTMTDLDVTFTFPVEVVDIAFISPSGEYFYDFSEAVQDEENLISHYVIPNAEKGTWVIEYNLGANESFDYSIL